MATSYTECTTVRSPVSYTYSVQPQAASSVEQSIYSNPNPVSLAGNNVITVNGETGVWTNQYEVESWRGEVPLSSYAINQDPNPTVIRKRQDHCVNYDQNVSVRYLNPPKPAPHGDIVIREEPNIPTGPAPPIVIRQEPPRPATPPTLVVREAPPAPPASLPSKFVSIPGKRLSPPPRKVVVEKLPVLPPKPQNVIIERWLPYEKQTRRVIYEKNTVPDPIVPTPKNVIVQWETPCVNINKTFTDLGVVNADPEAYVRQYGSSLKSAAELPAFVRDIKPPAGLVLAADASYSNTHDLVGDVHALGLIDLDRAGLSEYKSYVSRVSPVTSFVPIATSPVTCSNNFLNVPDYKYVF